MKQMKVFQTQKLKDYVTFSVLTVFGLFLWKPTYATVTCDNVDYSLNRYILSNISIQSFQGISSSDSCLNKCSDDSSCHSINWYSNTSFCQINRGTHLSYPEGLVANSTGHYILYSGRPMVACTSNFCSDGEICFMENDGEDYRCEACDDSAGMEDGRIKDSQLSASSSSRRTLNHMRARLNTFITDGGWNPSTDLYGEYLQINLTKNHIISKVATQGLEFRSHRQWVTKYHVNYSDDGVNWQIYKYAGYVKDFQGNMDASTVVANVLPIPVTTKLIRFLPIEYKQAMSMRVEVYGCASP